MIFKQVSPESCNQKEKEEVYKKKLYIGDSWFGSVRSVEAVAEAGDHAVMIVKTNHGRYPKAWLEEKMKDFPGGTWIVLQGKTKKGVYLLAIGYKYSKKRCFVLS